jgi:large conductance mechanosensitive channel
MLKDFKKFIMRGNVIDLAVAVVIGAAFGAIVTKLVEKVIMPLIAALIGQPSFDSLSFTVNGSTVGYGYVLTALVNFLIVAAAIFFMVVVPMNHALALAAKRKTPEDPTEKKCPQCLSDIPVKASKCAFCTSSVK